MIVSGSKHIYLGLYNDEFEAAKWYDRALVRLRGSSAATNFLLSNYQEELSEYHEVQQAIMQRPLSPCRPCETEMFCVVGDTYGLEEPKMSGPFENWVKYGRKGGAASIKTCPSDVHERGAEADTEKLQEKKHLVSQLIMRALTESHETCDVTSQPSDPSQ